jgi:HK97 family phage major capsid protein
MNPEDTGNVQMARAATSGTAPIALRQAQERLRAAPLGGAASASPGPPAKREFESIGEFLFAARFKPDDQRLQWQQAGEIGTDFHAEQRMDDGPSGGFAIPTQFRSELLQLNPSAAIMRPAATVVPAGSPPDAGIEIPALDQSAETNMYGGVVVAWTSEGGQKQDTSAKIRQIALVPQEVSGTITITDKLLRNWSGSGNFLGGLLRQAIVGAEDIAFLTGNGVNKPQGVLNASAAIDVNRATPGQITYADVLAMDETLFGTNPEAFWCVTKRARTWLRQLKNPAGYFIWQEDATAKSPITLLSHPVKLTDRLPTLGNRGDLLLMDGSKYLIKDGSGPFVAFSEHVYFTQNKTVCKVFWNVDGQCWMKSPVMTENGDLQAPFVILN